MVDTLDTVVSDPGGNSPYDHDYQAAGGTPDPSVITLISPTIGSTLLPTDTVTIDITNPSGVVSLTFFAVQDDCDELVADQSGFTDRFSDSTSSPVADGNRYVLRRAGGWLGDSLSIETRAAGPGGD